MKFTLIKHFCYILKIFLITLWKVWFFFINILLVLFSIISIPFLFSNKYYPIVYKIHRIWGKFSLLLSGISYEVEKKEEIDKDQTYIVIANHRSIIDIMLIYALVKKPLCFIGKSQLSKLPLFGYIYKKSNILVDRQDRSSRIRAFKEAQIRLDHNQNVCLFPEGGIPKKSKGLLGKFHDGAFALAIEKQLPILAFSIVDTNAILPYNFFKGGPGKIYVRQLPFISTKGLDPKKDKSALKEKVYHMMYDELKASKKELLEFEKWT